MLVEVSLNGDPEASSGYAYRVPDGTQLGDLVCVPTPLGTVTVPVVRIGTTYDGPIKSSVGFRTARSDPPAPPVLPPPTRTHTTVSEDGKMTCTWTEVPGDGEQLAALARVILGGE